MRRVQPTHWNNQILPLKVAAQAIANSFDTEDKKAIFTSIMQRIPWYSLSNDVLPTLAAEINRGRIQSLVQLESIFHTDADDVEDYLRVIQQYPGEFEHHSLQQSLDVVIERVRRDIESQAPAQERLAQQIACFFMGTDAGPEYIEQLAAHILEILDNDGSILSQGNDDRGKSLYPKR